MRRETHFRTLPLIAACQQIRRRKLARQSATFAIPTIQVDLRNGEQFTPARFERSILICRQRFARCPAADCGEHRQAAGAFAQAVIRSVELIVQPAAKETQGPHYAADRTLFVPFSKPVGRVRV
jgi:hypothetical protein